MTQPLLWALAGLVMIGSAAADTHPKMAEIEEYIDRNPLESRLSEMTANITPESMALNRDGFRLYSEKKYKTAVDRFKQAISADKQLLRLLQRGLRQGGGVLRRKGL